MSRRITYKIVLVLFLLVGCAGQGPAEIHYGLDQCDYCKMTIADKSFGSEMVTSKGKVYKFDSIECLAAHFHNLAKAAPKYSSLWVTDFREPGTFVRVDSASIVVSEKQKSPMGVGLVAFSSLTQAEQFLEGGSGQIMTWPDICTKVARDWAL